MSSPTLADPPPETAPDDDVPELDGGPEAPESGKIELPRRGPSLVTRAVGLLMPVAILAGGVVGFMALASLREPPAAKEIVAPVALVETVPVGTAKKSFDIVTTGSVVPFREITVAAEVDGRIVERGENLRAGRFVEKGELLARIDPTDFRLAVKQWEQEKAQAGNLVAELRTNVANAQAALDVAREALELRDRDVDRLRRLEGRARTARDVDDALLARTTTKTSVVELESKLRELESSRPRLEQAVELADARLEQARADLQRTELRAPAAGVIVESTVEQDNFVRRGDPIAILDDVSAVEVRCPLEDVEVAWVRAHPPSGWRPDGGIDDAYRLPPVPATVTYDVLGNTYAWSAELCRIEGLGADRATRTVPVRLLVPEPRSVSLRAGSAGLPIAPPGALARGMFVEIRLHATADDELIAIPENAVRPGGFVWVERDGKLAIEKVPMSKTVDGEVLVPAAVSPVRPGDALVVSPLPFAVEGMPLRRGAAASEISS